jgi:predicted phosphodiesterase
MRIAIFGDIHANLEALEAVLKDAAEQQADEYACLGDVVGYNANPRECLARVRQMNCPVVKGNHDEMASMEGLLVGIHPLAEEAINWTREQLNDENKQWLRDLEMVRAVGDFTIVHATLDSPHKWGYVFNQLDAAASLHHQRTQVCFYGHTHAPRAYIRDNSVKSIVLDKLQIEPGKMYFVNVGSVGQPRDGDWRAAYCLYDTDQQLVELRRIEYDIWTAQAKIIEAGLPPALALRLGHPRKDPPNGESPPEDRPPEERFPEDPPPEEPPPHSHT